MRKTILALAMLLALTGAAPVSAQRHRHTPRTAVVDKQKDAADKPSDAVQEPEDGMADNDGDEGIEAYSDTTSTVNAADTASYATATPDDAYDRFSPRHFDDPFSWFAYLCSTSFWGVLLTILIVGMLLLLLLSPLIIVLLIIRYIIRRHNDRVRLAEKAMESGRPMDDRYMPLGSRSPEYMWRRGVKNVTVGVGLMLFFWFLGAESLVGIGGLIACMGAGQMFMARHSVDGKAPGGKEADESNGFDDFQGDIRDLKFGDDKEDDKKA